MNCEIKGRITVDLGVTRRGVTSKGLDYEIREYVIFGKSMQFSVYSGDGPVKDPLKVGDDVIVNFNVSAKEYTDKDGKKKWFNSVQAWKIQK